MEPWRSRGFEDLAGIEVAVGTRRVLVCEAVKSIERSRSIFWS